MSLYNFNDILKVAQQRNYKAIGSFNLHCIEMLPAFFLKLRKRAIAL